MCNALHAHWKRVAGPAAFLTAMLVAIAAPAPAPAAAAAAGEKPVLLTPKPAPAPRINGPEVYGCRPGRPLRSEERRGGEEGRSRWSPAQ